MKLNTKHCLLAGGLCGLVNGLFGAGGGLVLVPILQRKLHLSVPESMATSVAVILPVSLVSAGVYLLRGQLDLTAALPYLLGGGIGGFLGGRWMRRAPVRLLEIVFSLMMLYAGVRNLL